MVVNGFACVPQRHARSHVEVEDYRSHSIKGNQQRQNEMGMSDTAPSAKQRGAQHPKPNGARSRYLPASTLKAPKGPTARDHKSLTPTQGATQQSVDCESLTPTQGATQQSVDCESLTPTQGATQQSMDCESLTPAQGATQQSVDCESLTPTQGATLRSVDFESSTPTQGATQQSVDCESLTPTQGATQQCVGKRNKKGRKNTVRSP